MPVNYQDDLQKDADARAQEAGDVSMIPIIGAGMSAGKTGQARQLLGKKAEDIINDVQLPSFSNDNYGEYSLAGEYNPEAAQYQTISEDPRTREYQMQALQRLQGLADNAAGSMESLGRYNAISDANAMAAQQAAGVRNQMAMRGQGGSGMDFVLQQQAGQMAADRAQGGALNAAQQAALQRLQGTQGVMAGASNIRGMDANVAGRNADIINQFNLHNTGARNDAQRMNLQARQGVNNANVDQRNKSLDRRDRNTQQGFGNAMTKATGRGNALQGMSNAAGQTQTQQQSANGQGYGQAKDIIGGIAGMFAGDDDE